jgi:hypothetical protein
MSIDDRPISHRGLKRNPIGRPAVAARWAADWNAGR